MESPDGDILDSQGRLRDQVLFSRGFVFAQTDLPSPNVTWVPEEFLGLRGWRDPRLKLSGAVSGSAGVAILGEVIELSSPLATGAEIAEKALAKLRFGEAAFLDFVDGLAGRYVILFSTGSIRVLGDAAATKAVFYHAARPFIIASHAHIVAEAVDAGRNPIISALAKHEAWKRSRPAKSYPGDHTPFKDVLLLTANMTLSADDLTLRRIWPRSERVEKPPRKIAETCLPLMRAQMEWLIKQDRPIVMSGTAGLDSRTSLAAVNGHCDKIRFFTHFGSQPSFLEDANTFSGIASDHGLDHILIDTKNISRRLPAGVFAKAAFFGHTPGHTSFYYESFPDDTVHIRSNLAEIGRAFYRRLNVTYPEPGTASALARSWRHMGKHQAAVEAFDVWSRKTGLFDVGMGYDYLDLFYWEHRMPAWYGVLLLESDIAFDTLSLFNARIIFLEMLSAPLADRIDGTVQRELIAMGWPELMAYPVNGKTMSRRGTLIRTLRETLSKLARFSRSRPSASRR